MTLFELEEKVGITYAAARRYVSNFANRGTIERVDTLKSGAWKFVKK